MSVSFDKKLAELDAYLQMLISENESLDKKLLDYTRSSNTTINSYETEIEGIINIKTNLEKLLGSIKHAIVLLQIAKVSSRSSSLSLGCSGASGSSAADLQRSSSSSSSTTNTPQPPSRPARPTRSSKLTPSSSTSRDILASTKSLACAESSNKSAIGGRQIDDNNLQQQLQQQTPTTATTAVTASAAKLRQDLTLSHRHHHQTPLHDIASRDSEATKTNAASTPPHARGGLTSTTTNNNGLATNLRGDIETSPPSKSNNIEDEDDDDAFFDAADEQQNNNHSKSITNSSISGSSVKQILDTSNSNLPDTSTSDLINATTETITKTTAVSTTVDDNKIIETQTQGTISTMSETNNNVDTSTIGDGSSIDWDAMYEEEDEEELGNLEGQGSVIKHLLSQIRIGMDLTKVVLPTFILERRSLLEMYADFFAHPDLFSAIADVPSPEERMIQLVRWYLSAFHAGRKSSLAKKPYNPILGEIFKCQWKLNSEGDMIMKKTKHSIGNNDRNGNDDKQERGQNLTFVAEQVSHHPPVSAFYAENKEKSISCCAHIYTKSKYLGLSVGVHNIGQGVINLTKHNETYTCTFPSAYGRSILTVPWVELGGPVTITCEQTGYKANIEFVMKPFYGGRKHRVTGEILRPNNEPILTIDGEWNGIMYSKSPPSSSEKKIFVDTTNLPVIKKHVEPVTMQDSFESRNVWKEVTRALKMKDVNSATAAKSYIEQRQRDLLKDRLEQGVKWKTRYFMAVDGGWRYAEDGKLTSDSD